MPQEPDRGAPHRRLHGRDPRRAMLRGSGGPSWARALSLIGFVAIGCDDPGNTGQWAPDASLVESVPWLNGVLPVTRGGQAVVPGTPDYPSIATGLSDPGSRPADCSALAGVETSPGWMDTF